MLIVTRRTGECVHIAESALVAGKVVPPAPARRPLAAPPADTQRLRRIAAADWPATETERLGDWVLGASGGFTRRANSAAAYGDPGLPLPRALEYTAAWYAARGLPGLVQLALPQEDAAAAELDRVAEDLGWTAEAPVVPMTAPPAPVADAPGAERVLLEREPTPAWLAGHARAARLPDAARAVLAGGGPVWFARVADPGGAGGGPVRPAAIGRMTVAGRWAVLTAVEVAPEHRRTGLATAVTAALAGRAITEGAAGMLLQVEAGNAAALSLWTRLGFAPRPGHHYRRAPGTL